MCPNDGSALSVRIDDPLVGTALPRHYRILARIGSGAMSVVYKGIYEPLSKAVAIKLLKSHLVSDPQTFKRFQREAKTAGSLDHPNIVGVLDFGVTDQAVPYIIMDYLEGRSLSDILDQEGQIALGRAVKIFFQVADALAYTHAQGVIHRDIKPSNIIILEREGDKDVVKIVDFGIAKMQSTADSPSLHLTNTGEVFGTPLYVSPEQAMGKPLDGRSDIYALGSVMYEAITGNPLFAGDTAFDIIRKQILEPPAPMDKVRPDITIPKALKSLVESCLAKDPLQRYQSMDKLRDDLKAILDNLSLDPGTRQSVPIQAEAVSGQKVNLKPVVGKPLALLTALRRHPWLFFGGTLFACLGGLFFSKLVDTAAVRSQETSWQRHRQAVQEALSQGRWADAEASGLLAVRQASLLKEDKLALSLNDLALCYFAQDNYTKAETAARQALSIRRNSPSDSSLLSESLSNLSMIDSALGKYQEAESLARQALSLRESLPPERQGDLPTSLLQLAKIECHKGNLSSAEQLLKRALSLRQKSPLEDQDESEIGQILTSLGMVSQRQGQYALAENFYNQALSRQAKSPGGDNGDLGDTLKALATLDFLQKKDRIAEEHFNRALGIYRRLGRDKDADAAEVLTCLGILFESEKNSARAEQSYLEALSIRQKLWGSSDPRLLRMLRRIQTFYQERNRTAEAQAYDRRIKEISRHSTGQEK